MQSVLQPILPMHILYFARLVDRCASIAAQVVSSAVKHFVQCLLSCKIYGERALSVKYVVCVCVRALSLNMARVC
jgi:hypothetical protein